MESKKILKIALIILLLSFIIIYAGQFFTVKFSGANSSKSENPVKYTQVNKIIDGKKQSINILEVNTQKGKSLVKPALSFNSTFGFETLSAMNKKNVAYAAVNGGFFHEFGEPSGLVIINGKIASSSSGQYRSFIIKNGAASFRNFGAKMAVKTSKGTLNCMFNRDNVESGIVIYNSYFGSTNRLKSYNTTVTVVNNYVTEIHSSTGTARIPEGGYLITYIHKKGEKIDLKFKVGDRISSKDINFLESVDQGLECGPMIVRDGKNIAPKRDRWIISLENTDPRTAIGILHNGDIVLVTCDGRQPGHSYGMTGQDFAEYLISLGVRDAAMLDGGASTEMIVNNKIVNKISGDGTERPMGGAILVNILN